MPSERWSDDRLDDLAGQVRTVAGLSTQVGVQGANIDALEDAIVEIKKAVIDVRDECRAERKAAAEASRWTKGQIIAAAGPFLTLIGIVVVILQGSGGG
jgi:hypothetical protein